MENENNLESWQELANSGKPQQRPSNSSVPPVNIDLSSSLPAEKSEADQIKEIQGMRTNFVFFFGNVNSGKSAILSTLLYHLRRNFINAKGFTSIPYKIEGGCSVKTEGSQKNVTLIDEYLQNQRFVPQTAAGTVQQIRLEYFPYNAYYRDLPGLDTTFLELSGENFKDIQVKTDKAASLRFEVDIYFRVPQISMLFILVTKHQKAAADDKMMHDFIQYVEGKDKSLLQRSRIMLFISEWDTYEYRNRESAIDFVRAYMPHTYAKIKHQSNVVSQFSIGTVTKARDQFGIESDFITEFDLDFPYKLWKQVYSTFTGQALDKKPYWRSLFGL